MALPKHSLGYPVIYLDKKDRVYCGECASEQGLTEKDGHVYEGGSPVECEECGEDIESAYGEEVNHYKDHD